MTADKVDNTSEDQDAGRMSADLLGRAEMTGGAHLRAKAESNALMEAALERGNLMRAYQRVMRNRGAAGVDGLELSGLKAHLQQHWPSIKARLLAGSYQPLPVRRVSIPKPNGGERELGIPTVVDRLIQQALHQVLSPLFEPTFSAHSYGFRPGRNAHQAVHAAREHVASGCRWVVDLDLAQFFDRVNHDLLMERLSRSIQDPRVLNLIRRYLKAGVLAGGVVSPRREGTPQGGPLSPLLSNILLTDLDRELERRGHRFVRYADDCNIYVCSQRAGERVLASVTRFLEDRLKLKVNTTKSAVDRPWRRRFLGYSVSAHHRTRLRLPWQSRQRLVAKVRQLLRAARGRSLTVSIAALNPVLRGWAAYFRWVENKRPLEEIDGWIRRKLRAIVWRQWKRPHTRAKALMRLGLDEQRAWRSATNGRGPWWNAGASHMNAALPKLVFDRLGLVSVLETTRRLQSVT